MNNNLLKHMPALPSKKAAGETLSNVTKRVIVATVTKSLLESALGFAACR